jgi:predicted transposase YdaD
MSVFCCLYFLHLAIPCELRYNEIWRDVVEKEVSIMCNLSQGIKEESEAKGEEKARTEIVLNMHKKGYSLDQIVEITNLDVSAVEAIIG